MGKRNLIDYAFKSYVLKEHANLLKKQKKSSLLEYAISTYNNDGVLMPILTRSSGETLRMGELHEECKKNGLEREFLECIKINHASYKRTNRLRERIETMLLNGSCIFLTLTFTDETLKKTSAETRRRYVRQYLKQYGCKYVANIDFGSKNHREHYHALINCDKIDFTSWRNYGNINAERVRNKDLQSDKTKLAKYICKLSNHAIKETTKRSSLIYSR